MSASFIDLLKSHPSVRGIEALDLARLCASVNIIEVQSEEKIFSKEESASKFYLIIDGKISLYDGNKITLEKTKNMFVGEEAAFISDGYQFSAVAKEKSKLIEIPKQLMDVLVAKYPYLYSYFFNSFNQNLSKKNTAVILEKAAGEDHKEAMSFKILMSWIVAFIVPVIVYSSMGTALDQEGRLFVSVLSAGVVLWIFNVFPDFVPALMILTSTLTMGLVPLDIILSGFSSSTFFLILGITGLSILVAASGILYRIMLLFLRYLPVGSVWYNLALFFIGAVMTPVIPSIINRTKVMGPLTEDLISLLNLKKGDGASTKISASAFYSVTLLSSIFLTGSIMNFVVIGLFPFKDQQFIASVGWLVASAIPGIILLIIHFVGSSIFFVSKETVAVSKEKIDQQLKVLGGLRAGEISAIGTVILFAFALFTMPFHKIPVYWLSLFLLFALLSLKIVGHKEWLSQTDWSFLIFLGCIIGITASLRYLNVDALISDALVPVIRSILNADNTTGILSLLLVLTLLVRLFLPIGPAVIIMMTLSFSLADSFGMSLWPFGFTILMVCDIWFFPYQAPFYLSYVDSFQGNLPYAEKRFLLYNGLVNFGRIVALYLSLPYWKSLGII